MLKIESIRKDPGKILVLGAHQPIIQAMLDFDFLSGKKASSVAGIMTSASRFQKYFWGNEETLLPCFKTLEKAKAELGSVQWMLNLNSGRRAYQTTQDFFAVFSEADGGHIFAEDVPETHALSLYRQFKDKTLLGPAGVGLLIPGALKLGAIGGVDYRQLEGNRLYASGNVAVLSASGGMVNEVINMVAASGHDISFSLCFGGDRFPITRPMDAFLAAEADRATTHIVYYGELGGYDEYELVELIKDKKVTKPVIAYIAGVIGENFDTPVQFGHAKALAGNQSETASAKREELLSAGALVAHSMGEFAELIQKIPSASNAADTKDHPNINASRHHTLFTSTIAREMPDGYTFAGQSLQSWAKDGSIAKQITAGLLGHPPKSKIIVDFVETVFLLSVDHGPHVSGALNSIITARAGKGVVDSLAAGLLTVGPRFGGAVSDAARAWFDGVRFKRDPAEWVDKVASAKQYIGGIGHKKYRLGLPDPRVALLSNFASKLKQSPHYNFARQVEELTTAKKGTLILNVDGTIAALMLDILMFEEKLDADTIDSFIDADFFNALFVIPRTVGFISHYLDQKRLDEGLFRLPDDDVLLLN